MILLALNEINFDVVKKYLTAQKGRFSALEKLIIGKGVRTTSEYKYEELEPWIQWTSIHTGKRLFEHGIFRLGDIVDSKVPQIFELLENAGYKVGSITSMNVENRLNQPAYFIPDPWTKTPSDSSWWSRSFTEAVSQAVNDNAQSKITLWSLLKLGLGILRFGRLKNYGQYLYLVALSPKKPWLKSLILDLFLHDLHWSLFNSKKPNFSSLFLNAGAHIQHHYFLNAKPLKGNLPHKNPNWYIKSDEDPLAEVLYFYDKIIGEYFSRSDTEVVLATGLSQIPYDRIKYYYRLNDHANFLINMGISFVNVSPRMTRDFLIEFANDGQAQSAQLILSAVKVDDGLHLFGEIENRGNSLFVTLTYPNEVRGLTSYIFNGISRLLEPEVSFVAIKNGMHQSDGFLFCTNGFAPYAPVDNAHVSDLGKSIMMYFDLKI